MENRVSEIEAKIRAKRDAEKAAKKRIELELKNEVAERLKPYTIPTHEAIWEAKYGLNLSIRDIAEAYGTTDRPTIYRILDACPDPTEYGPYSSRDNERLNNARRRSGVPDTDVAKRSSDTPAVYTPAPASRKGWPEVVQAQTPAGPGWLATWPDGAELHNIRAGAKVVPYGKGEGRERWTDEMEELCR